MTDAHSEQSGPVPDAKWDMPAFLLADAAEAACVKTNILKAWLDRQVIPLGPSDREALGRGSARVFTLRRVVCIAIMAELARLGMTPSSAAVISAVVDRGVKIGDLELSLAEAAKGGHLIVAPQQENGEFRFGFYAEGNVPSLDQVTEDFGASVAILAFGPLLNRVLGTLQRRKKWPL